MSTQTLAHLITTMILEHALSDLAPCPHCRHPRGPDIQYSLERRYFQFFEDALGHLVQPLAERIESIVQHHHGDKTGSDHRPIDWKEAVDTFMREKGEEIWNRLHEDGEGSGSEDEDSDDEDSEEEKGRSFLSLD
jgi:hypothetical protein